MKCVIGSPVDIWSKHNYFGVIMVILTRSKPHTIYNGLVGERDTTVYTLIYT